MDVLNTTPAAGGEDSYPPSSASLITENRTTAAATITTTVEKENKEEEEEEDYVKIDVPTTTNDNHGYSTAGATSTTPSAVPSTPPRVTSTITRSNEGSNNELTTESSFQSPVATGTTATSVTKSGGTKAFGPTFTPMNQLSSSPKRTPVSTGGSGGLSELSKQLRILQAKNEHYSIENDRLERQVKILSDLQGLHVNELRSALQRACEDEAYGELQHKVASLRSQLEALQIAKSTPTPVTKRFQKPSANKNEPPPAPVPDRTNEIMNLQLRIGELEELDEQRKKEMETLYEQLLEQKELNCSLETKVSLGQTEINRLHAAAAAAAAASAAALAAAQRQKKENDEIAENTTVRAKDEEVRQKTAALDELQSKYDALYAELVGLQEKLAMSNERMKLKEQELESARAAAKSRDEQYEIDEQRKKEMESLYEQLLAQKEYNCQLETKISLAQAEIKRINAAAAAAAAASATERAAIQRQYQTTQSTAVQAKDEEVQQKTIALNELQTKYDTQYTEKVGLYEKLAMANERVKLKEQELESVRAEAKLRDAQYRARFVVQQEQIKDLEQQLESLYTAYHYLMLERHEEIAYQAALQSNLVGADEQVAKQLTTNNNNTPNKNGTGGGATFLGNGPRDPDGTIYVPGTSPVTVTGQPFRGSTTASVTGASQSVSEGTTGSIDPNNQQHPGTPSSVLSSPGGVATTPTSTAPITGLYGHGDRVIAATLLVRSVNALGIKKWKKKNAVMDAYDESSFILRFEKEVYSLHKNLSHIELYKKHPFAFIIRINFVDPHSPILYLAAENKLLYKQWISALSLATTGLIVLQKVKEQPIAVAQEQDLTQELNASTSFATAAAATTPVQLSPTVHDTSEQSLSAEDQEAIDIAQAIERSQREISYNSSKSLSYKNDKNNDDDEDIPGGISEHKTDHDHSTSSTNYQIDEDDERLQEYLQTALSSSDYNNNKGGKPSSTSTFLQL